MMVNFISDFLIDYRGLFELRVVDRHRRGRGMGVVTFGWPEYFNIRETSFRNGRDIPS